MVSHFSYLIFLGIIFFTNGKPAHRLNSLYEEPEYELNRLLKQFVNQGNYDVMLNHHEDRLGRHHEDTTKITYNSDQYGNAESNQGSYESNLNYNYAASLQDLKSLLQKRPTLQRTEETASNGTIYCTEELESCVEIKWNATSEEDNSKHSDEVVRFLNELDTKLKLNGPNKIELRCYGNGCAESRNENNRNSDRGYNNVNGYLRCNGKRCSTNRDDYDTNYGNNERCHGGKCSRKANDIDETSFNKDISHILRISNNDDDDPDNGDDRDENRDNGDGNKDNRDDRYDNRDDRYDNSDDRYDNSDDIYTNRDDRNYNIVNRDDNGDDGIDNKYIRDDKDDDKEDTDDIYEIDENWGDRDDNRERRVDYREGKNFEDWDDDSTRCVGKKCFHSRSLKALKTEIVRVLKTFTRKIKHYHDESTKRSMDLIFRAAINVRREIREVILKHYAN